MGGNPKMNRIDNLIPLCRKCHIKTDYDKDFNQQLKEIVKRRMENAKTN